MTVRFPSGKEAALTKYVPIVPDELVPDVLFYCGRPAEGIRDLFEGTPESLDGEARCGLFVYRIRQPVRWRSDGSLEIGDIVVTATDIRQSERERIVVDCLRNPGAILRLPNPVVYCLDGRRSYEREKSLPWSEMSDTPAQVVCYYVHLAWEGEQVGPYVIDSLSTRSAVVWSRSLREKVLLNSTNPGNLLPSRYNKDDRPGVVLDLHDIRWEFPMDRQWSAEMKIDARTRGKYAAVGRNLLEVAYALESYYIDHSLYPPPVDEEGNRLSVKGSRDPLAGYLPLRELTTPVEYLHILPVDPFSRHPDHPIKSRYRYAHRALIDWTLASVGPDGELDTNLRDATVRQSLVEELEKEQLRQIGSPIDIHDATEPLRVDYLHCLGKTGNGDILRQGP